MDVPPHRPGSPDGELSSRETTAALLDAMESGDASAFHRLVPVVYDELRRMARRQRARGDGHPTLRTTELVHEAWIRLAGDDGVTSRGRAYFMGAAARAMRRVLIDAARRRSAARRGGDPVRVTLDDDLLPVGGYAAELVDLDRALSALEEESPRLARTVECRFFAGMTVEETAAALQVSARTVKGDWALARAWLYDALGSRGPS